MTKRKTTNESQEDFNINKVIKHLRKERKIFATEADFQVALAQSISSCYPPAKFPQTMVQLEYCPYPENVADPITGKKMYIDILVLWESKCIPIELKYKTEGFNYSDNNNWLYDLKKHGAYTENRYRYWRDVRRIETIASSEKHQIQYKTGFAIFLTNDPKYYDKNILQTNPNQPDPRVARLNLSGNYSLHWEAYSTIDNDNGQQTKFEYLVTQIPKAN